MSATVRTHVEARIVGQHGASLYSQAWLPVGQPRAVLVIVHGAFEHGGRYAHVAERMTASGFACYALDARGHGRSDGRRTNIGRMTLVVGDLDQLVDIAADRHPGVRIFLLGHSLGSVIALEYALRHQDRLAGLILSGAAVDVSIVSPLQRGVAKLLSSVAPNLGILKIDSSKISRDPEVIRTYDNDPLVCHGRGSVRMVAEALASCESFPARLETLRLPLLLIHGTADELSGPSNAPLIHDQTGSTDKTIKLYDGLYHEALNEPERETVIGDLIAWLAERT
jgi:alpha-beta hydrolase superfamily lysophospholipase